MTARIMTPASGALPEVTLRRLVTLLLAGALATIAFDLLGQSLSPMPGFARLSPVPLANQVIEVVTGSGWMAGAQGLHDLAGLVAFPLGWLLIATLLAARRGWPGR